MTIIKFPDELQEAVFELIDPPKEPGSVELTLKLKDTLDESTLNQLKEIGVKFLTPVK